MQLTALAPLDPDQQQRHKLRNLLHSLLLLAGMVALLAACGWIVAGWPGVIMTIVLGGISVMLDARGLLPDPLAGSNLYLTYISYSFIFVAIIVLLNLFLRSLTLALQEARTLNSELEQIKSSLEVEIAKRTKEMVLAADIAQNISSLRDLRELLDQSAALIQATFNLYYVQIYLLNETSGFLELYAGTGGAGQALLDEKHQLRAEATTINGTAYTTKQPVIVANTQESRLFKPNPLLPLTRSEIAIPLVIGEQVVGVLDLQSSESQGLSEESLPAFMTLAGQLAIAIHNATLFTEREQITASLQEEQERVQTILESVAVPMVISVISDGTIAYVNDPMTEAIREAKENLIGQVTPDFYNDPQDRQAFLTALREHGQVSNFELHLKRNDGEPFWAIASARVINYQGQPAIITTLVDIDARRKAEAVMTKRASKLEAVAQVGSIATTILDDQQLLQNVVDLTKTQFNLYHAHIYLLDTSEKNLILTAGAGEAGRTMTAQGRIIPLNQEQSLVARAARTQQGVIVNDVMDDPGFLPHPLLPETRSEMAVPMVVGDELLGVLDIQSDVVGYFTAEDVNIQTILAGQVAVALQNARTFTYINQQAAIIENSPTFVANATLDGKIAYMNETGLNMLGYDHVDEVVGLPMVSFTKVEEREYLTETIIPQVMRTGKWRGDRVLVGRDGRQLLLDQSIFLVHDKAGNPSLLATTAIDITERKRAEEELYGILNFAPDAIGLINTQTGLYENFNRNTERLFGLNHAALTKVGPADMSPEFQPDGRSSIEKAQEMIQSALAGRETSFEWTHCDSTGREFPCEIRLLPLPDERKHLLRFSVTDITERKYAEDSQQRLASTLEERLQDVNALQRAMTHEGWQAFFAAKDRPVQGYRFHQDSLRLISRYELDNATEEDLPLSARQATNITNSKDTATSVAPMQVRGETIGILGARNSQGKPIDSETRDLLTAISGQVAEALERARLFEETELGRQQLDQRAQELQAVAEISTAASTLLDKQAFMDTVTSLTKQRFDIYHCNIFTLDREDQTLQLAASSWQPQTEGTEFDTSIIALSQEQSLVAKAAGTRQVVLVNDTRQDPSFLPSKMMPRTRSELAIPLVVGDDVFGVLDVQGDQANRFTDEDIRIFTTLAAQVAISLQNAELFANAQRRAEREVLINAISQKIQSAPTVQSAMQTAVSELGKALKAQRAFVDLQVPHDENGR